ncbi:MAG TPA: D-alanine--D-alanine ligase [Candidatus Wolfebacteria bacterium]|nr:D-alanine--D-alanine ligase [Candidatus Wolfebacteria bacterium]
MKKKLKIGVLMGGPSAEHDISLKTGEMIIKNLNKDKYFIFPCVISKKEIWLENGKKIPAKKFLKKVDLIFNAMHGEFGEDGVIQKLLEQYKIAYTGSGPKSSRLAMDKIASRKLFKSAGLNIPMITTNPPLIVKPIGRGSSIGMTIVYKKSQLKKAINLAKKYDKKILAEEYLSGREFTCGIIENYKGKKFFALPITEIIPNKKYKFFDYEAKYKKGASNEITPAKISNKLTKEIQKQSIIAHKILKCRHYSRSDFIINPIRNGISNRINKDKIYILELNTLPGMTETSLLPQSAALVGLEFPKLLDKIISLALKK